MADNEDSCATLAAVAVAAFSEAFFLLSTFYIRLGLCQ